MILVVMNDVNVKSNSAAKKFRSSAACRVTDLRAGGTTCPPGPESAIPWA